MGHREYDKRKIAKKVRDWFYRQRALIKRVVYTDPDANISYEDKKVVWCKDKPDMHIGWCCCNLQIVCPFVQPEGKHGALTRCNRECHDPQMKEAIEAWCTLNPHIY